jgi:hypothetical protein
MMNKESIPAMVFAAQLPGMPREQLEAIALELYVLLGQSNRKLALANLQTQRIKGDCDQLLKRIQELRHILDSVEWERNYLAQRCAALNRNNDCLEWQKRQLGNRLYGNQFYTTEIRTN